MKMNMNEYGNKNENNSRAPRHMHRVDVVKYQPIIIITLYSIFFAITNAYMLLLWLAFECSICVNKFFLPNNYLCVHFVMKMVKLLTLENHIMFSYGIFTRFAKAVKLLFVWFHCLFTWNYMSRQKFQNDFIRKMKQKFKNICLKKSQWNDWTQSDIDTIEISLTKVNNKIEKELTTQLIYRAWQFGCKLSRLLSNIKLFTTKNPRFCPRFIFCVFERMGEVCVYLDYVKDDIHKIVENVLFIAS